MIPQIVVSCGLHDFAIYTGIEWAKYWLEGKCFRGVPVSFNTVSNVMDGMEI